MSDENFPSHNLQLLSLGLQLCSSVETLGPALPMQPRGPQHRAIMPSLDRAAPLLTPTLCAAS